MTIKSLLLNLSILCISLSFGFFTGLWFENQKIRDLQNETIEKIEETAAENIVPVLIFEFIENGVLYIAKNNTEIRIKIKNEMFIATDKNNFKIPLTEILPMLKTVPAPEGMFWVASKRGKTYWPLDAPQAFLISVKNRQFYKTEEEAILAGKRRK